MRLDHALAKVGAEVVNVEKDRGMTLYIRLHQDDPKNKPRWAQAISILTRKAWEAREANSWGAEVSKLLLTEDGERVVFYWRVVLSGNVTTAQRVFGECLLEALRSGVEITQMPLIGQVQPVHDPQNGKIKGGYKMGGSGGSVASSLIASHFRS